MASADALGSDFSLHKALSLSYLQTPTLLCPRLSFPAQLRLSFLSPLPLAACPPLLLPLPPLLLPPLHLSIPTSSPSPLCWALGLAVVAASIQRFLHLITQNRSHSPTALANPLLHIHKKHGLERKPCMKRMDLYDSSVEEEEQPRERKWKR